MTTFLLRDDDANATTDPAQFERAYAPLLDAGLPINLSIIPEVALDTRAPDGARERFLSSDFPDEDRTVPLAPDSPIVSWMRARRSHVEPLLHGLTHQRVRNGTEFGALSADEAGARMDRGKQRLEAVLARPITGFVAPWDALSAGSLEAAVERFSLVSTSWLDRHRLPLRWWGAHYAERAQKSELVRLDHALVLRHRGGPINGTIAPESVATTVDRLARRAEVCVIVLHHWMFWDSREPHPVVRALARALARRTVLRASDCVERLSSGLWAVA